MKDHGFFRKKIKVLDWYHVINEENVDVARKKFSEMFVRVINSVDPVKSVSLKQGCEPWLYGDIFKLISNLENVKMRLLMMNIKG